MTLFIPLPSSWNEKLCKEVTLALAVGKIHQTILYNIACGKDWKKFKLGDDMFHKLSMRSQEFREDMFFGRTLL